MHCRTVLLAGYVAMCAAAWAQPQAASASEVPTTPNVPTPPPALSASVQRSLDRAVAAYEAGRLTEARRAFERLSRQHVPAADYNLAVMHTRGEMPRSSPQAALQLLDRAAQAGFVTAQWMLAQALDSGELGRRDLPRANDWYERAALAGNVDAQVALATAYYLGRGRPLEPARAAYWYRAAAQAGDVGAMYLLAAMYEHGDGLGQNLQLARDWYVLAAQHGDAAAPGKVREVDAQLAADKAAQGAAKPS